MWQRVDVPWLVGGGLVRVVWGAGGPLGVWSRPLSRILSPKFNPTWRSDLPLVSAARHATRTAVCCAVAGFTRQFQRVHVLL